MPVTGQDLDFQCHMSWSFIVFNGLRREAIVDIGEIVDHHFLSINLRGDYYMGNFGSCPKTYFSKIFLKLFGFPIIQISSYLKKVFPEVHCAH